MRRSAIVLSLLCVGACAKKAGSSGDAVSPEAASAPGGGLGFEDGYARERPEGVRAYADEEPSFEQLEARFEELDAELSAQDMSRPKEMGTGESSAKATSKQDLASRCERICSLKDAICDVSERICAMAEMHEHEDDPKYGDACTRSESRCEEATTACSTCAG